MYFNFSYQLVHNGAPAAVLRPVGLKAIPLIEK
jgi:hypothetical protein